MKNYYFLLVSLLMSGYISGQTFINELNIPFINSSTDQYIELRGNPSSTIDSGTYLVFLRAFGGAGGRLGHVFDLSGYTFGSNGYMVLLQANSGYNPDSSSSVYTASGTGWGDLDSGNDDIINDSSWSALLITATSAPIYNTDYDSNNDGVLQGAAANWSIIDAIAFSNNTNEIGDINTIYGGKTLYISSAAPGPTTYVGGTVISTDTGGMRYFGRIGDSTGETIDDWVGGATQGTIPNMNFLNNTSLVTPSSYAGQPINTLGSLNFDNTLNAESFLDNNLKLWPNPFKDDITIKLPFEINASIDIYNLLGNKILSNIEIKETNTKKIDLSTLSSGTYILSVKNEAFRQNFKLIKN